MGVESEDLFFLIDDDLSTMGSLRSGASKSTFLHILYEGDGNYYVEFDDYETKVEVEIPVKK